MVSGMVRCKIKLWIYIKFIIMVRVRVWVWLSVRFWIGYKVQSYCQC